MKKIMAAILCIALALSCMSFSVLAEGEAEFTTSYTVDSAKWRVSGVAPLTTVAQFKANFEGADVKVVNVDRKTVLADDAYATENVYASINNKIYNIRVDYPYNPIMDNAKYNVASGKEVFNLASSKIDSSPMDDDQKLTVSEEKAGFTHVQSALKVGIQASTAPTVTAAHRTIVTRQTEKAEPVYVIDNNAPRYAYLRSHKSANASDTALGTVTKGKVSVTTGSFKTDQMGNVSLHHNISGNGSGDATIEKFYDADSYPYMANVVHFLEDGSVKLGGTNIYGYSAERRSAKHEIKPAGWWKAGQEYTVSVVQKMEVDSPYGYIYGVYIDGEKVFPRAEEASYKGGCEFSLQKDGSYLAKAKVNYGGSISSILIGAAPVDGNDIKMTLTDAKVYTVASAAAFEAAKDKDAKLTLTANDDDAFITVDEATETITATGTITSGRFNEYADGVRIKIQNGILTAVSADGLSARTYKVNVTDGELPNGFYADEEATEKLGSIAGLTSVRYTAILDRSSGTALGKVTPVVFIAVFKNGQLDKCVKNEGIAYSGELTKYTTVCDLSEYNAEDTIEVRAFTWDNATLEPLTEISEIKNK